MTLTWTELPVHATHWLFTLGKLRKIIQFQLCGSFLTLSIFQCYFLVLFQWYIVQVENVSNITGSWPAGEMTTLLVTNFTFVTAFWLRIYSNAISLCFFIDTYFKLSYDHNQLKKWLPIYPSCSVQVQILLAACQKFTMVRISDNGPGWK